MPRKNLLSWFVKSGSTMLLLITIWSCSNISVNTETSQISPPSPISDNTRVTPSPKVTDSGPEMTITTQSYQQPFCASEEMDWLEKEHTVTCYSYWGPAVREAVAADLNTRINAAYLNLESGEISERTADIYYQLSCGSTCYPRWRGMEGVIIVESSRETPTIQPTLEECVESLSEVKDEAMPPKSLISVNGHYSCVQTQDGRVGWIKYEDDFRSGLEKGESQITYWIWDQSISSQK